MSRAQEAFTEDILRVLSDWEASLSEEMDSNGEFAWKFRFVSAVGTGQDCLVEVDISEIERANDVLRAERMGL